MKKLVIFIPILCFFWSAPELAIAGEMELFLEQNPELKDTYDSYFLTSAENELRHALDDLYGVYRTQMRLVKDGKMTKDEVERRYEESKEKMAAYFTHLKTETPEGASVYYYYSVPMPSRSPSQEAGFVVLMNGELVYKLLFSPWPDIGKIQEALPNKPE